MNKYNLLSITVMTVAAIVGQLVVAEEGGATPFIIEQDENITITSTISHILNGEYKVRNSNLIVKYIDSTGAATELKNQSESSSSAGVREVETEWELDIKDVDLGTYTIQSNWGEDEGLGDVSIEKLEIDAFTAVSPKDDGLSIWILDAMQDGGMSFEGSDNYLEVDDFRAGDFTWEVATKVAGIIPQGNISKNDLAGMASGTITPVVRGSWEGEERRTQQEDFEIRNKKEFNEDSAPTVTENSELDSYRFNTAIENTASDDPTTGSWQISASGSTAVTETSSTAFSISNGLQVTNSSSGGFDIDWNLPAPFRTISVGYNQGWSESNTTITSTDVKNETSVATTGTISWTTGTTVNYAVPRGKRAYLRVKVEATVEEGEWTEYIDSDQDGAANDAASGSYTTWDKDSVLTVYSVEYEPIP